ITLLFVSGSASSLVFRQGKGASALSFGPPIAGSILLIAFSILVSTSGSKVQISDPFGAAIPALAIQLYVDGLAAFFMLILGLVTLAVSVYSIGYSSQSHGTRALGFLFNMFVLSMFMVIASNSIFTFLVFWEMMSLVSFFLVIYEHEDEANIK